MGAKGFSNGVYSDRVEDTERRFVLAGVRVGNAGGPLVEVCDVVVARDNDGRIGIVSGVASASEASSSCTLVIIMLLSSLETTARRRVASLGFRCTPLGSSEEAISTTGSSGVEGVEGAHSEEAEWKLLSEAAEDGCGTNKDGGETSVGDAEREAVWLSAGAGGLATTFLCRENHGWAKICAIVNRFVGSTFSIFLIKSRASGKRCQQCT